MTQEKTLVVENNIINVICALRGLKKYNGISDVLITGSYDLTMGQIDKYNPTAALVDLHLPGYSGKELPGQAIGRELKKRGIPYLYVTGVSHPDDHHHNIIAIEIKHDNGNGLETVLRFDKLAKDPTIWQAAYDKLNELYGRNVE